MKYLCREELNCHICVQCTVFHIMFFLQVQRYFYKITIKKERKDSAIKKNTVQ